MDRKGCVKDLEQQEQIVKLAVNGDISFGSKLNAKQLVVIAERMNGGDL